MIDNKEMILRQTFNWDAYAKMDWGGETRKNRIKNQCNEGDLRWLQQVKKIQECCLKWFSMCIEDRKQPQKKNCRLEIQGTMRKPNDWE